MQEMICSAEMSREKKLNVSTISANPGARMCLFKNHESADTHIEPNVDEKYRLHAQLSVSDFLVLQHENETQ